MRSERLFIALIALIALFPASTFACPICFQIEDANAIAGVRAGVIVLMAVTVIVLSAVAAFSIRVWRNGKRSGPDA